ncbi:Uma2 family endonuclease [Streptomyces sp. SS8]
MSEEMRRFEEIDTAFPDLRGEMIDGEIRIDAVASSARGQMVLAVASQLMPGWCVMTEVDTVYGGWHGRTLLRPDVSVAGPSYRGTRLKQFPADELLLVAEVVSESNPENDLDRKVGKYAVAGIPYYLVVNPVKGVCLLHSEPVGERYRAVRESEFGEPVPVGEPIGTVLDTTTLYVY